MELRRFDSTDSQVSVIGQGTWNIDKGDRDVAIAALRLGLDLGMTHIDTAEMYGDAEEIIAEAIEGRRNEVFLVSKVLPQNASLRGTIAACERSLARLQTDWLDCYLLHWRGKYPLEDTIEAFEQLQREGKILSWGVSNFDVADLQELESVPGGLAVVGYAPFGHGRFPGPHTLGGRVLQEIAARHNATPRQVALRFLVRRPSLFVIPKSSRPEHAAENAEAGDLYLSEAELAWIDESFPRGSRPRELPVL